MQTILDNIRQDLFETLEGIRTTAGYFNDFIVEYLNQEDQNYNRERDQLLMVWEGQEEKGDPPLGAAEYVQPFHICAVLIESENSTLAMDERINLAVADIEKALSTDRNRGGYAVWTEFDPPTIEGRGAAKATVTIVAKVRYRTAYNSRFTQG